MMRVKKIAEFLLVLVRKVLSPVVCCDNYLAESIEKIKYDKEIQTRPVLPRSISNSYIKELNIKLIAHACGGWGGVYI